MKTDGAENNPHHGMANIWFEILVGASAWDHCNAVFLTQSYGILRDTGHACRQTGFGAHHTMHPDMPDTQIDALLDDLLGNFWVSQDKDCIWLLRD